MGLEDMYFKYAVQNDGTEYQTKDGKAFAHARPSNNEVRGLKTPCILYYK